MHCSCRVLWNQSCQRLPTHNYESMPGRLHSHEGAPRTHLLSLDDQRQLASPRDWSPAAPGNPPPTPPAQSHRERADGRPCCQQFLQRLPQQLGGTAVRRPVPQGLVDPRLDPGGAVDAGVEAIPGVRITAGIEQLIAGVAGLVRRSHTRALTAMRWEMVGTLLPLRTWLRCSWAAHSMAWM